MVVHPRDDVLVRRMTTMSRAWVSADDVAALLGISRVTVYDHVRRGNIPAKRIGRALRFDLASIDQWATRVSARTRPARIRRAA